MSIAETCRAMRGIQLTREDETALYVAALGEQHEYSNGIADRNDYGIMLARTVLAVHACRATRSRVMPEGQS
jgi:hypothetical protein